MKTSRWIRAFLIAPLLVATTSCLSGQGAEIHRDWMDVKGSPTNTSLIGVSIEDLKTKADAGDRNAQYTLGARYYNGRETKQDYTEAIKWFQKVAEHKVEWAQYALGCCYDFGRRVDKDHEQAFKWYFLAAGQGLPATEFMVADCYKTGDGVRRDFAEAVTWYRRTPSPVL